MSFTLIYGLLRFSLEVNMDKEELLRRYHADYQFSFGGLNHIKNSVNIRNQALKNVLANSNIYTEFREFKRSKYLPPIRSYGESYLWEADLMFFTHPSFSENNDGYLYILAIIDTFTKTVKMKKLKSKNTTEVTNCVRNLFKGIKPKYLRVDAGGEFLSNMFSKMCQENQVILYVAMEPIKCAFIERFNRTFKRLLIQIMEQNNSLRWIDFLPQALDIYHGRNHRSLQMSPDEADEEINHDKILRQNLKRYSKFDKIRYLKNTNPPKFKKGQFVKLFRKKGAFTKGYAQNVTKEYFEIYHINRKLSKDRYYLKDLAGDKVIGSFYEEYLVLYKPPAEGAEYKLDPNHNDFKRKNIRGVPHIFVKWLGWPKKFNQWVPVNDVRHLLK